MPFTVFWDVDTQVDFIDPAGKLYVRGAEGIVPNLERLTRWASASRVLIVASACAHRPGDAEFSEFPPHCLVGTPGQQKIPETRLLNTLTIPNAPIELPPGFQNYDQLILEKQRFDVFTNPNTTALLSRLGLSHGVRVVLYGVVTEICVACAARGLQDRGCHVLLVEDAIHHLDAAKGRATIEEVRQRGGATVTIDELLRKAAA